MDRAIRARRLIRLEAALGKARSGVFQQTGAFGAQACFSFVLIPAVERDHQFDRAPFFIH
jgi:hypothetical protein